MSKKPSLPGVDAIFSSGSSRKEKSEESQKAPPEKPEQPKSVARKKSSQTAKKTSRATEKIVPKPVESKEGRGESSIPVANRQAMGGGMSFDDIDLEKYSLYFHPKILERLEEVWFRLRRKRKEKIPKWKIVNVILDKHLGDMDQIERLLDGV